MINAKDYINNLILNSLSNNQIFKRNIIKEYLQILILDFLYTNKKYSELFFYGGSCLAHCYGLPRLSEDLDFVDSKKRINLIELRDSLADYFKKNTDLHPSITIQKFRLYLKFPLLRELKLSKPNETDLLLLKVEIFDKFDFCPKFNSEFRPIFKFERSILVRTFDLPTLMSIKIRAILFRKWEKIDKSGNVIAKVKGRDYYDLMWYLEKKIKPNLNCIEEVKNIGDLKEKLIDAVEKTDAKSVYLDLESLIDDANFVRNLSKNIKNILISDIEKLS